MGSRRRSPRRSPSQVAISGTRLRKQHISRRTEHIGHTAEQVAARFGHADVLAWLARTREWTTRLHHLEVLTEAQARAELRAGADVHAAARAGGPTPLSLARDLLAGADDATPGAAAARLVLRAAEPWSKANHALFPAAARARAVELMSLASMLSHDPRFSCRAQQEMLDIWHAYTVATVRRDSDTVE